MINYNNELEIMLMECSVAGCVQSQEYDGTFQVCVQHARNDGWYITKDDDDGYLHFCPDHAEKEKFKRRTAIK